VRIRVSVVSALATFPSLVTSSLIDSTASEHRRAAMAIGVLAAIP
jgi:hypothetical protein